MRFSIIMTERAKADLASVYRYIAYDLQSPQTAGEMLSRLEKAIMSLDQMPERFRVYDHEKWKDRNMGIMQVKNYLVFYIPAKETKTVTILRILYGGRDIRRQLDEAQ